MEIIVIGLWIISLVATALISRKLKPQTIEVVEDRYIKLEPWLIKPSQDKLKQNQKEAWSYARGGSDEDKTSRIRCYDIDGTPWVFFRYGKESVTLCKVNSNDKGYQDREETNINLNWAEFDSLFPEYIHFNPSYVFPNLDTDPWVKVKEEKFKELVAFWDEHNHDNEWR